MQNGLADRKAYTPPSSTRQLSTENNTADSADSNVVAAPRVTRPPIPLPQNLSPLFDATTSTTQTANTNSFALSLFTNPVFQLNRHQNNPSAQQRQIPLQTHLARPDLSVFPPPDDEATMNTN